jgi:hypothetical protein
MLSITNSLIAERGVLVILIVAQLVKKFLALYVTRRFITVDLSPACGTYPELDEYISLPHAPFLKYPF